MSDWTLTDTFVDEWNRIRHTVDTEIKPHPNPQGADGHILPAPYRIKIDGPTAVPGKYRYLGKLYNSGLKNSPTDLSLLNMGTLGTRQVEIWCLTEMSGTYSTPLLSPSDVILGFLMGYNSVTFMPIYLTDASPLPVPQYQFQGLFTGSNNALIGDFVRAHPAM